MHPVTYLLILGSLICTSSAESTITIDVSSKQQQIDGFGFSQAFGRARAFEQAPEATRQEALDLLFGTETGAGLSILRNRIGSGGSGDSILPSSPGSPSATPEYQWDGDDRGQVWLTRQAAGYGVQTIVANAWSAPGFMKTSGDEALPGYLCGSPGHECDSGDWQQAYADMIVQYVKFYADEGLNITHLAFLNEPDWEVSYSQMQISDNAQEAISFIPILDETIEAAGLSHLRLVCCDSTGWDAQDMYTTALVDAGSTGHLDIITSHSYTSQPSEPLEQTSLPKWNTEAGPDIPFITTWYQTGAQNEGFTWAVRIAQAIVESKLSAYLFWQGFQLENPESAMHLVDALDGVTPTPSGIFWAFAMWSRHIRPGANRVATSGSLENVIAAAVENVDGSVVVVLTSSASEDQQAQLEFANLTPAEASAWVTDNENTFSSTPVDVSRGGLRISLPARSVVTVKVT